MIKFLKYTGNTIKLLILVLFLMQGNVWASEEQNNKPLVIDGTRNTYPLGYYTTYLEDKNKQLHLKDILTAGIQKRFKKNSSQIISFGFTESAYWICFTITTKDIGSDNYLLELDFPLMDKAELYWQEGNDLNKLKINGSSSINKININDKIYFADKKGFMYPFVQRMNSYENLVFNLPLSSNNTQTFYMYFENKDRMEIPLFVWDAEEYQKLVINKNLIFGMYYGLAIFICLLNMVLFIITRDRIFLDYTIFILLFCIYQTTQNGHFHKYLSFDFIIKHNGYIHVIISLLLIAVINFTQGYSNIRVFLPRMNIPLEIFKYLFLLFLFLPLVMSYPQSISIFLFVEVIVGLYITIVAIIIFKLGYWPMQYYLTAWGLLFLFNVIVVFKNLNMLPVNFFTMYAGVFGSILEIIIFSLVLGLRVKKLRDEKNAAEIEMLMFGNELKLSQDIINNLLPEVPTGIDEIELAYKYVPAMGIGGDFIDICHNKEKNLLGIFICDVSGHGIHAALLASVTKMALFEWEKDLMSPGKILSQLRSHLKRNLKNNFITATVACLDLNSGKLTLASAGHLPPVIIHKEAEAEIVSSKGHLIHSFFNAHYEEVGIQLVSGDRVVFYTDGIFEARNKDGELLGRSNFKIFGNWLQEYSSQALDVNDLCSNIFNGTMKYIDSLHFDDDFTIVGLEYKGSMGIDSRGQ